MIQSPWPQKVSTSFYISRMSMSTVTSKTECASQRQAPLPWTLTTFIASELGTCSRFCWWKLVDRAWDSSVLESCSCWTGANGVGWLYVSVTVKPETRQKIRQSHQKKTKKLALQIKISAFWLRIRVSFSQQALGTCTHNPVAQAPRQAGHARLPPPLLLFSHCLSHKRHADGYYRYFQTTRAHRKQHTHIHTHTHTWAIQAKSYRLKWSISEGPENKHVGCYKIQPPPEQLASMPTGGPSLTLRQASLFEGLLCWRLLLKLVHVPLQSGRGHEPVWDKDADRRGVIDFQQWDLPLCPKGCISEFSNTSFLILKRQ